MSGARVSRKKQKNPTTDIDFGCQIVIVSIAGNWDSLESAPTADATHENEMFSAPELGGSIPPVPFVQPLQRKGGVSFSC